MEQHNRRLSLFKGAFLYLKEILINRLEIFKIKQSVQLVGLVPLVI